MEEKFLNAWFAARERAQALGVRLRPMERRDAMQLAHRCLDGHRCSDGFDHLARLGKLSLTLEALAVKLPYTALFSDEQANNALQRLLEAGYGF